MTAGGSASDRTTAAGGSGIRSADCPALFTYAMRRPAAFAPHALCSLSGQRGTVHDAERGAHNDRALGLSASATALGVTLLFAAGCASSRAPALSVAPAAPPDASAQAVALADEYLSRFFERNPELGETVGWPDTDHGAAKDRSLAAQRHWETVEDELLERAQTVDQARLNTLARVSHGIVLEVLTAERAMRACRRELWDVSSAWGWQQTYSGLADIQPVGAPEQRTQAVARLRALARSLDDEIQTLREGQRLGYLATRDNVERVVKELDVLLATLPRESVFTRPAARNADPSFRSALETAVEQALFPAMQRYRGFLATEYLPRARAAVGVSALPDGAACYRASVRRNVTLDLAPQAVNEIGVEQIARINVEMESLARRSFGTADVAGLLTRLRSDPAYTFGSREEVLEVARDAVERAVNAAPRWFGRMPHALVRVEPYPEFMAQSAPAEMYRPSSFGDRLEGIFYLNTFTPRTKSRAGLEATAFHETVPGHHLQIAIALESPTVSRAAKYVRNSGFVEGWALYAERLAGEMGLYGSDVSRMGLLSNDALRAARLVVDSGIHAFGWSRQQAIDYVLANTTASPAFAASEVDRYAARPGQALGYMLGRLEIQRLRDEAQRALGPRLNLRAFHDAVLEDGCVPLPMLRDKMTAWVRAQAAR